MDAEKLNPINAFEKLSRNQKLLVFGGAAALGGYLWYRSKSKAATSEEEAGEEAPTGTEGATAEGSVPADEGIIPEGGSNDPYLGGGFGGSAPANASNGTGATTPTSTSDGTVPSGNTTNVGAGGVGSQIIGEGGIGQENVTDVTGGGAPATPHPSVAHLTSKHPHHPKHVAKKAPAKHSTKKVAKRAASGHTQHKHTQRKHAARHKR